MAEESEEYPGDAAAELLRVVPAGTVPAALNNGDYIGEFAAALQEGTPVLHPLYSTDDTEDGSYDVYVVFLKALKSSGLEIRAVARTFHLPPLPPGLPNRCSFYRTAMVSALR